MRVLFPSAVDGPPARRMPVENEAWRRDVVDAALQGTFPVESRLEALLDRLEGRS
ncbi:hypothetical protein [Roseovarius salinarum]|uniref:hypothetical protein n=1 Tax=Roseovarius salinarum TaxID=1981892 RepID=UPI001E4AF87F|nr:hypothetical protein [Roseovarius salinarum]